MYNYFDLTNQQIWLRRDGRVDEEMWDKWRGGIRDHFANEHFVTAWRNVENEMSDDHFEALDQFLAEGLRGEIGERPEVDETWVPYEDDELGG